MAHRPDTESTLSNLKLCCYVRQQTLTKDMSAINHCPLWCLGPDVRFANLRKSLIQQLTPLCCAELLM